MFLGLSFIYIYIYQFLFKALSHRTNNIKPVEELIMEKHFVFKALLHKKNNIKKIQEMPTSKETYTIVNNNIVSDKGARMKLKITRPTHTSNGRVGDLTTTAKNQFLHWLIVVIKILITFYMIRI